jgi:ferredoxin
MDLFGFGKITKQLLLLLVQLLGDLDQNLDQLVAGTGRAEVPVRFRVEEDDCTCCSACGGVAPAHFALAPSGMAYACVRQPETEAERRVCEEAASVCPVDCIRVEALPQPSSSGAGAGEGGTTTV